MSRVLVVDDSKLMRLHISNHIKEIGHEVIAEAANTYEALEQCKTHKPDIITLDINMPKVQGVEGGVYAVKLLKEIDPKVKIIMITASGDQKEILQSIQYGATGYVLKPVNIEKLNKTFAKVLRRR